MPKLSRHAAPQGEWFGVVPEGAKTTDRKKLGFLLDVDELTQPEGTELFIGVIILGLFLKVEGTIGSWIISHTRQVHPVPIITAGIVINELLFKVFGSGQPVLP